MTQATKRLTKKELRQPDEFQSLSRSGIDWARANARTVQIAVGVLLAVLLLIGGVSWYLQARDAESARRFYGASELFKREQWDLALTSFSELAADYGGTTYGNLAKVYAGRAALQAGKPAEAVPFLREFVASPPSAALEQLGRVSLGRALSETGDADGAREQLARAVELEGPARPQAQLALAQLEEAAGNRDRAVELYQQYLTEDAAGAGADLARMRLARLGVTPPPSPAGPLGFPAGGMPPITIQ